MVLGVLIDIQFVKVWWRYSPYIYAFENAQQTKKNQYFKIRVLIRYTICESLVKIYNSSDMNALKIYVNITENATKLRSVP